MKQTKKIVGLWEDRLLKRVLLVYQIHKYYQRSDTAKIYTDNGVYNNIPIKEITT